MTFNATVIGGALNLRSTCSTSSTRLTQIPNDTAIVVEIVEDQPEWFSTSYGGYTGFVVAQYVAITADGGECTPNVTNYLNVRKTTSTSSTSLYKAYPSDSLRLLDYTSVDGWYRVSSANGTGWAVSDYLDVVSYPQDDNEDAGDDNQDSEDADTPDYYGVTRLAPYAYSPQGYYQSTADRFPATEDRIAPIVADVTIPLWSVVGFTDVFRTEYNGEVAYVNIDFVELVENGSPTLSQALGSTGAGVINCKYHLAALHYHPDELSQVFDGVMTAATKVFQQQHNLTVTGIIDATTRALLCSGNAEYWYDDDVETWYDANSAPGYYPPMQWFMGDSMWATYPWPSTANSTGTIGNDGNSITTLAMLATTMMYRCVTPVEMAELTLQNNYRDQSGRTGIIDDFYVDIENFYPGVIYAGEATTLDEVKRHLAEGGLAVAYVTADDNNTYTGGATQLLVYRIDEDENKVYVRSPNANKNPAPLSIDEWEAGESDWFRKAYLYDRTYG